MSDLTVRASATQERDIAAPDSLADQSTIDGKKKSGTARTGSTNDAPAAIITIGRGPTRIPANQFKGYGDEPNLRHALAIRRLHSEISTSRSSNWPAGSSSNQKDSSKIEHYPMASPLTSGSASSVTGTLGVLKMAKSEGVDGSSNGESVTVTGSGSGGGSGGSGGAIGNSGVNSGNGSSNGGGVDGSGNAENLTVTAKTQHITLHGHDAVIINNVAYLAAQGGKGVAVYQAASGAFVPIKISDIDQDIANDVRNVLGRDATEADYVHSYQQFQNGQGPAQVRSIIAYSDEATSKISEALSTYLGRSLTSDDHKIMALNIQSGLASGQVTMPRVLKLIGLGASLASIANNMGTNQYTPVPAASPTAYSYTDGVGRAILLDSKVALHDVIQAGNALHDQLLGSLASLDSPIDIANQFYNGFKASVGQGGRFDIQRDSDHIQYQAMVPGANYIVGVFSAAVGLNAAETAIIGSAYALNHSRDSFQVIINDSPLWTEGVNDYNGGFAK